MMPASPKNPSSTMQHMPRKAGFDLRVTPPIAAPAPVVPMEISVAESKEGSDVPGSGPPVAPGTPPRPAPASGPSAPQRGTSADEELALETEAEVESVVRDGTRAQLVTQLIALANDAAAAAPSQELQDLKLLLANFSTYEDIDGDKCVVLPLGNNGLGKSFLISCLSEMTSVDDATYRRASREYVLEYDAAGRATVDIDKLECLQDMPRDGLIEWVCEEPVEVDPAQNVQRNEAVRQYAARGRFQDQLPYLYPSSDGLESTTSYITESIRSGIFHCAVTYYSLDELKEFVSLYWKRRMPDGDGGDDDNDYDRNANTSDSTWDALQARLQSIFGDDIPVSASHVPDALPEVMRPLVGKTRWFCGNGRSLDSDRAKCRDIQQQLLSQDDVFSCSPNEFARCRPLIKTNRIGLPSEFLQDGVRYLDVPGMNDADQLKEHYIDMAVESTDVLVIVHERTLDQAGNVRDKLADPNFGSGFFDDFRRRQREIMFLILPEKGDQRGIDDFLQNTSFERKKAEVEKQIPVIRKQFRTAFKRRWANIGDAELDELSDRVIVEHCRPLLHLSCLANETEVIRAKAKYGEERVNHLLDFIGARGLLELPVRLKLEQLRNQLQRIAQAIDAEHIRLENMRSGEQKVDEQSALSAEHRTSLQTHCTRLACGRRKNDKALRDNYRANISDVHRLKNDCRKWAEEYVQRVLEQDNIESIAAHVRTVFQTKIKRWGAGRLSEALSSAFRLNQSALPLQRTAANEIMDILAILVGRNEVADDFMSDVLFAPIAEHFKRITLEFAIPPDTSTRSTRSGSALPAQGIRSWLADEMDRFIEVSIRQELESTTTAQMQSRRRIKEQVERKLESCLLQAAGWNELRVAIESSASKARLVELTEHVIDEWLDATELEDLVTDFAEDMLTKYVDNVYAAIVTGIFSRPTKTPREFFKTKENKQLVRERLGKKWVRSADMNQGLDQLWNALSVDERNKYETKAKTQPVIISKLSALYKHGMKFVKRMLEKCAGMRSLVFLGRRTKLTSLLLRDTDVDRQELEETQAQCAMQSLQRMKQLLDRSDQTAETFIRGISYKMCSRMVLGAVRDEIIKDHPQLDFTMTYKTSAHRAWVESVTAQQQYIHMKDISQACDWRPYDVTQSAQAVLTEREFTAFPATGPVGGVESLFANVLHQLKGAYAMDDVRRLHEYILRWMKAQHVHDQEFREKVQHHKFEGETFDNFVERVGGSDTPHPFLLECLCDAINIGFFVWSMHPRPVLFGNLSKKTKVFNLLCVRYTSSVDDAVMFESLVVRRYHNDIRLKGNPSQYAAELPSPGRTRRLSGADVDTRNVKRRST